MYGKLPHVDEARDPSLILWENLGTRRFERFFRILFTSIIACILLLCTALINLLAVTADTKIQAFSPQVECADSASITAEQALNDYKSVGEKQGLMTCFCMHKSTETLDVS